MTSEFDFIVVGSGCTGAQAAQTLVESGAKVALVDMGYTDDKYASLIPDTDFSEIRKTDASQNRYFLGDDFEGVPMGAVRVGSQLTPPRKYLQKNTDRYLPLSSQTFAPMESLAYGGLGSGWGLGCNVFSDQELKGIGLSTEQMLRPYEVISRRIGIAAADDDAAHFTMGGLKSHLKPLQIDRNSSLIYKAYQSKKKKLNQQGLYIGQPPLAYLSEDFEGRKKSSYSDMEFWSDHGESAYRPWITINTLKKKSNFTYLPGRLALSFKETSDQVELKVRRDDSAEIETLKAKKLVLASGVLGTARIVLRSLDLYEQRLPLVCNPYSYAPCINTRMFGKQVERFKSSMAQLVLFYDPKHENRDAIMTVFFSYRSLLLFKLLKEIPLGFPAARFFMQHLQSVTTIAAINHPDFPTTEKYLILSKNAETVTGDILKASYKLNDGELKTNQLREKVIMRTLWKLRCIPLKKISLQAGASIHYGGTLPFSQEEKPLTTAINGRLHGTKNIYIADGSSFRYLPAKGPTFSLMANAHRIASLIRESGSRIDFKNIGMVAVIKRMAHTF